MKNKGFTLVEIVISLGILVSIGLLLALALNKVFTKNQLDNYESLVNKIVSSADVYLSNNGSLTSELHTNRGFIVIKLSNLSEQGLLETNLINPETGELVNYNDSVKASLDANGSIVFTYPYDYTNEEYLQTLNKELAYEEEFYCFGKNNQDLDTINLGLIDTNGLLVSNYFTSNPSNISCSPTILDTTKIGTFEITYTYLTRQGIEKTAIRNFVIGDNVPPEIENIKYTPTDWTKNNVTITAKISDKGTGIASYSISKDSCGTFINTTNEEVSGIADSNGLWYVCAKDKVNNISEKNITINNIDKNPPEISTITKSTSAWTENLTLSTTINDNASGLIAYAVNQSSNQTNISWTNITNTKNAYPLNKSVTENGTYYIWAKDAVGNISKSSITISNIGVKKTSSASASELSSSSFSGSINAGVGNTVVEIINYSASAGSLSYAPTFNGSTIYYTGTGSSYSGTKSGTCTQSATWNKSSTITATRTAPSSNGFCRYGFSSDTTLGPKYTCAVSTTATLRYPGCTYSGDNSSDCRGKCNRACPGGGTAPILTSPNSDTCTSCSDSSKTGTCTRYWSSTCTAYGTYSCPSGYTRSGSSCSKAGYYSCSQGWSLSNDTCYKSCQVPCTYYKYSITVSYWIVKK